VNCLTDEQLEQFLLKEKRAWRKHLAACERCALRLEEIRLNLETEDELAGLLENDPENPEIF
jgi:hypothetical protein